MTKTTVSTDKTPRPVAAYSQGVRVGDVLYLAGQAGVDPATGALIGEDIQGQTRQSLTNLRHVLEAAGGALGDLVSVRVFISDHAQFAGMNEVYSEFFTEPYPVRTTVSAGLGPGMKVEIDGIAHLGGCA